MNTIWRGKTIFKTLFFSFLFFLPYLSQGQGGSALHPTFFTLCTILTGCLDSNSRSCDGSQVCYQWATASQHLLAHLKMLWLVGSSGGSFCNWWLIRWHGCLFEDFGTHLEMGVSLIEWLVAHQTRSAKVPGSDPYLSYKERWTYNS